MKCQCVRLGQHCMCGKSNVIPVLLASGIATDGCAVVHRTQLCVLSSDATGCERVKRSTVPPHYPQHYPVPIHNITEHPKHKEGTGLQTRKLRGSDRHRVERSIPRKQQGFRIAHKQQVMQNVRINLFGPEFNRVDRPRTRLGIPSVT